MQACGRASYNLSIVHDERYNATLERQSPHQRSTTGEGLKGRRVLDAPPAEVSGKLVLAGRLRDLDAKFCAAIAAL